MTKPPLGIANIFAPLLVRTFGQVSVKFDNRCCGILRFGRLGAKWLFEARFIGNENRVLKANVLMNLSHRKFAVWHPSHRHEGTARDYTQCQCFLAPPPHGAHIFEDRRPPRLGVHWAIENIPCTLKSRNTAQLLIPADL